MKITGFTIPRKEIKYGCNDSDNSCYSAVVNNHTDSTDETVIKLAAKVLYEMYRAEKEEKHHDEK